MLMTKFKIVKRFEKRFLKNIIFIYYEYILLQGSDYYIVFFLKWYYIVNLKFGIKLPPFMCVVV